jgi:hypothetical protein
LSPGVVDSWKKSYFFAGRVLRSSLSTSSKTLNQPKLAIGWVASSFFAGSNNF